MNRHDVVDYYSNDRIVREILGGARNREIAGAFRDGRYDQRPNMVQYGNDIVQMAKKGVTSFHYSVEHWTNPMGITSENYNKLRKGWDLIIDIDSKLGLDASKTTADLICKFLKRYGIRNFGIKFSGRRGFHIVIPWIMFPREIDYKPLEKTYPETPKILAGFIRENIRDDLTRELVRSKGARQLIETMNETPDSLNPFYFVEVEKDWGNRHMFRAPYSFNEKTWLVSVPIKYSSLDSFDISDAGHEKVLSSSHPEFFSGEKEEAADLLTDAVDWSATLKRETKKKTKVVSRLEGKIPEKFFPPCIQNILSGIGDGRKRSVFTLINFLRMMNWTQEEIETALGEWNRKNKKPLPENTIRTQIRYSETRESVPPANCFNDQYYVSFGVCRPDETCNRMNAEKTSNPVAYPFKRIRRKKSKRGFSCGACSKEFDTERKLQMHKGRTH